MFKKKILIICFALVCGYFLMSQETTDTTKKTKAEQEAELRIKKIALEIENLETEKKYINVTKPLTILGSLIGLITIFWTIYQGIKNIAIQTDQQKQNRISGLLTLLSDDKPEKRASGANGLSRYPTEVYQEIIAALKIEQVDYVRDILEDLLMKLPDKEFANVLKANRDTLINRSRLLGSFGATGEKIEITEALLGIRPDTRTNITANFKYFYDHGMETARYQLFRATQLGNLAPDIREGFINEAIQAARIAYSTSRIISRRLLSGKIISDLSLLDLNLANLYRLKLSGCNFSQSIVTHSICRHTDFSGCDFTEANFNHSDLFDCDLSKSIFSESTFNNVALRKAKAIGIRVNASNFKNSIFSQGQLNKGTFQKLDAIDGKFNGTIFDGSSFDDTRFAKSEFNGASFKYSTLKDIEFFGCEMRSSIFSECTLENVKFNGANLELTRFKGSVLKNCDFSGADMKGVQTDGWQITDCIFHKVKNFELPTA